MSTSSSPDATLAGDRLFRAKIERRFVANSGLIIGARLVSAGLSLATIPVLVDRLGISAYGTWEALLAFATLTSLFQLAVSGTLTWRVSEAYGTGDSKLIRRLARLGSGASWMLFLAIWPVVWMARDAVVAFLGVPEETRQLASEIIPIIAALVLLTGLSQTLEAVVSGCQRTGLVNVVAVAAQILNYSTVIVLALLGAGLWSLVAGQAAGFAGRLAGAWVAAHRSFGRVSLLPLVPGRSDWATARYSGLMTVGSVASALRDQTDKLILASLASPAWVGYYGIAARLSSLVMEIISFFYMPILTAVGALHATGDWNGVRRLYSRVMTAVSTATGLVVVLVAGLADRLVILWLGRPIHEVTLLVWLLITGTASAAMLTGPGTSICRGCGRVGIETIYLGFNLALNVVFTVALVLLIGPIGTAVATGTTWAAASILFLVVLHKRLDLPSEASKRAVGTALVAAAVAAGVHWTSHLFDLPKGRHDALVSVVLLGGASTFAYFSLVVCLGLVSIRETFQGIRALLLRLT